MPDGGHRRGGELVAIRVTRQVDGAEQRPCVVALDGAKPPVDRSPARHARAVRRDDQHRRHEPMVDQRHDAVRIPLWGPEHPEVIDQVLRSCHEGDLDRVAAPGRRVEQAEQLQLASL